VAPTEDEFKEAFRFCDADNDGFISSTELRRALKTLGEEMDDEQFEQMLRDAGMDARGKISYEGARARRAWSGRAHSRA
jgi:Ca2+-binding EF-hand superfamily protein